MSHAAYRRPRRDRAARQSLVRLTIACSAVLLVASCASANVMTGHPVVGTSHTTGASASPVIKTVTPTPTPTMDFATIYAREQSGVVRIETLSCSDAGIGTGFLLSPTLVATVNHVINQSVVVSLIDGTQRTTGTVIGSDPIHDLALIQASHPLTGYRFAFAALPPNIGDQVATIGFPIGNPITLTHGDVSGLDRNITVNGLPAPLTGLIETDAAINPGNSGGPLIDQHGTVVGLVDALQTNANGIAYAVPSGQAAPAMAHWKTTPSPLAPASCPNPLGPSQSTPDVPSAPPGSITDQQAAGIVAAFNTYFGGINSGNYAAAYAVLSPRLQANATEQQFATGDATSYDFGITVLNAQAVNATTVHITLAFTSLQTSDKGPNGDTCDNWTLVYTMIQGQDGSWRIDNTAPDNGVEHTVC
jgi:serine protease Do